MNAVEIETCRRILLTPDGVGKIEKARALDALISEIEALKGIAPRDKLPAFSIKPHSTIGEADRKSLLVVEFDGGAKNIGKPGFGIGYGSYKIGDNEIVYLDFNEVMSANCAELKIACEALKTIPKTASILIRGDSQIALKWIAQAFAKNPKKISKGSSPKFMEAIDETYEVCEGFTAIFTEWRGRAHSVTLFGH